MIGIEVKTITVKKYRIICTVLFPHQKFSNEEIKTSLLKIRPNLIDHKCKNKQSKKFAEIMTETSLVHILEHLIIDFQIEQATDDGILNKILMGNSEWLDKSAGLGKIEFQYYDDIVAIASIKKAVNLLKSI